MLTADAKHAAVLGWPVHHSLSPRLHNYWLKQYGINGVYEAIATEPQDLQKTLDALQKKHFAGVNLTVPHKEQALKYVDEIEASAKSVGAINTIVMRKGRRIGSNTDVYGFTENIKSSGLNFAGCNALVIGAGGAARAVCAALLAEDVRVTLINRTHEKAVLLAEYFKGKLSVMQWQNYPDAMQHCQLLVNTTSSGMQGNPALSMTLGTLPKEAIVTDIVYNPRLTPLLKQAHARGNRIIDGLGMLLYQAQPAFEAWFGVKPEVTAALRAHVLEGLT